MFRNFYTEMKIMQSNKKLVTLNQAEQPDRSTIKTLDRKDDWKAYNLNGIISQKKGALVETNNHTYKYFRGKKSTESTVNTKDKNKKKIISNFFKDNFENVTMREERFFNNKCKTMIQFGAGVANYLTIKSNENPDMICIAYESDALAVKQLEANKKLITRNINLNECIVKDDELKLSYSEILSKDLEQQANIIAINIIMYLDGPAICLLLFKLINEAKPGTTIYFNNGVIDQNGNYSWYCNYNGYNRETFEVIGINNNTPGMSEWVEDLGGYKTLTMKDEFVRYARVLPAFVDAPGPLNNKAIENKYKNGYLPKSYLATFFSTRTDWKTKEHTLRASDGNGLISYDESFIVEKVNKTAEKDGKQEEPITDNNAKPISNKM